MKVTRNSQSCVHIVNRAYQVMCQLFWLLALSITTLTMVGCSKRYNDLPAFWPMEFSDQTNHSVGRFKTSFLAEQIDDYYRGTNPGPLGITTFVNVDDLYNTSTFGRMLSEQLMSELAMRGFDVIELRHSDALQFIDTTGEFALSRNVGSVRRERTLGGVIVGTYVSSPVRVYLNARLVDPQSSMVLSAASVEMEKTKEIAKLLRAGGPVATLERIPVRHIGFTTSPVNVYATPNMQRFDREESDNFAPVVRLPNPGMHSPSFASPSAKSEKPIGILGK